MNRPVSRVIAPRAFDVCAGTDSHVVDRGYSWSMTTAFPSILRVMIFTSPAFLSLKLSNFWITASATPMPVAYRDGGVKMWNFSEAHAAGRSQANVCRRAAWS